MPFIASLRLREHLPMRFINWFTWFATSSETEFIDTVADPTLVFIVQVSHRHIWACYCILSPKTASWSRSWKAPLEPCNLTGLWSGSEPYEHIGLWAGSERLHTQVPSWAQSVPVQNLLVTIHYPDSCHLCHFLRLYSTPAYLYCSRAFYSELE